MINHTTRGVVSAKRRAFFAAAVLALAVAGCSGEADAVPDATIGQSCLGAADWVGTWSASPMPADASWGPPNTGFEDQTLRQIVHISVGGPQLRVRFSNEYGSTPLAIGAAHVALQSEAESIVPWSDRALTFSGAPTVVIAAGEVATSDPVELNVAACSDLAVSIYVPEATGPATIHDFGAQTTYISSPGNFTGSTTLPTSTTNLSRYWLSGVDVHAQPNASAVVALGDSITDGVGSTFDANSRWPDLLSQRLNSCSTSTAQPQGPRFGRAGVLNQGISGNRLLHDVVGPMGLSRFDRDVLEQPGASHVIVMLGINDIGFPGALGVPDQAVTADQITEGLTELVDRAHAGGLYAYGATLAPFEGTFAPYYTAEGEITRQAVNDWIRSSGTFDAVIDFDQVLGDPAHPTRMLPEYDSGDHLHPNDAGYQAMANAIDLALIDSR